MGIARYYTIGAVVRDLRTLKELDGRLGELGAVPGLTRLALVR